MKGGEDDNKVIDGKEEDSHSSIGPTPDLVVSSAWCFIVFGKQTRGGEGFV